MHYLYLGAAIICEVVATTVLKSSESFTRLVPSALVIVGYAAAFYFLALTLEKINLGVAYAIWCAVGIVLISLLSVWIHGQKLDGPGILGITLIVLGVIVLNVFSDTLVH
jgi:small multidrug resistance pump